jgi:hypothetical protein
VVCVRQEHAVCQGIRCVGRGVSGMQRWRALMRVFVLQCVTSSLDLLSMGSQTLWCGGGIRPAPRTRVTA